MCDEGWHDDMTVCECEAFKSSLAGFSKCLVVDLPVYMAGAMVAMACRMGMMVRLESLIVTGRYAIAGEGR
jgi:hypothetical protein